MRFFQIVFALSVILVSQTASAKVKLRPGQRAGMLVLVNGKAHIENGTRKVPSKPGMELVVGDIVVTAEGSKAKLLLDDDTTVNLGASTRFALDEVSIAGGERKVSLRVLSGKFMAAVTQWFGSKTTFQVSTPTAVAGVRGTVLWGDTALDAICALHGKIEVKSLKSDAAVELTAGNCATQMGQGKTDPLQPTGEQVAKYLAEVTAQR